MKRILTFALLLALRVPSQAGAVPDFTTPVTTENIDAAAYAQWFDGAEKPIVPADDKDRERRPPWVLWTLQSAPNHSGFTFGASKTPGPRHLRIGFKEELPIGAVLTRGGGSVSVLKPGAAYPGNMADETQWIPAQRIKDDKIARDEANNSHYVLWTLPPNTRTRALRFTHVADVTDRDYAGSLLGAYVISQRVVNLAPQATAVVSANDRYAPRLMDENINATWEQWANFALNGSERAVPVSPESPEWVMLNWTAPVQLRGLAALFAGFNVAEAQIYTGPADVHPREAKDSDWKTIASFRGLKNRYPSTLPVDWLDFGQSVTTRALRLKITEPQANGGHPHVNGHTKGGKRVWIGELLALSELGNADLKTAILPKAASGEKPPIAVKFTLPEAGFVTLVIEDETGKRIRNLIADTWFEKGANTVWWDGSDDLGRDPSAAKHGLYLIPTQLVTPGKYRVRGLWHKPVNLKYEFGFYTAGTTPWETADRTGGWLSNHTPPSAVLFVPDAGTRTPSVMIGSYVSEGTAGLAWVDLNGKKWKGQNWVGGTWTGAPHLARDAGPNAVPGVYAYAGAAWEAGKDPQTKATKGEIRLTAFTPDGDKPVLKFGFTPTLTESGTVHWEAQIGGIAAHNGILVVSLPTNNKLVFVDAKAGKVIGEAAIENPHGVAFDAQGRLLTLSGTRVLRHTLSEDPTKLPMPGALIQNLENPIGITTDARGNIYISDRGNSHQIKVFSPEGKFLRAIGKPGAPKAGPYDALHMNNPRGVTIDVQNRLWVAEEDNRPKRVSVWNADGSFVKAFYGPAEYGGGGALDPQDKSRFYYDGMQFHFDWNKGTDQITHVFYRRGKNDLKLPFRSGVPQSAVYVQGRRYWHNAYNSNPTNGHGTALIFADKNGIAVPVAAAGRANEWDVLKTPEMAAIWPAGSDPKANQHTNKAAFFVWSDLNGDAQVQPNEVQIQRAQSGGVTVMPDLSFVVARHFTDSAPAKTVRFAPKFNGALPLYDINAPQVLVEGTQPSTSSGGDQVLIGDGGWTMHSTAPKPYKPSALGGSKNGVLLWQYPSLWPGLHASHEAPVPHQPGIVIGTTRLLGDVIAPKKGEPLWLINGNHGPIYVFTQDGLYVTQLFQDMRLGRRWQMLTAQRGMLLNEMTPSDENFWPSVTQTPQGEVYISAGRPNSIVKVEGLETINRIAPFDLNITEGDLNRAREYYVRAEAARQAAQGRGVLTVALRADAPTVDGKLDDWQNASWADIDKRGTAAYFNSDSKPYNVTGAVAIANDHLYAAWRTGDKDLLRNAGDIPNALFKTGGALDLMIGTNPKADPKRNNPVAGDVRLLITQVGGKTRALLYRAVADNKQPVPFSSPGRTITFDRVDDVSEHVKLSGADGNYEISIPLAVIGFTSPAGQTIQGDIGILRGNGTQTTQRVYWTNKATAIVADVPSEVELRPNLWGRWEFR